MLERAYFPGPDSPSSPDYIGLSLAAAIVLRAAPGRFYRDVKLGCINLLLTYPESCLAGCAYCGLSRSRSPVPERTFIHVDVFQDSKEIVREVRRRVGVPVSALVSPHVVDREGLRELRDVGADIIGVGLDAASPRVFKRTRKGLSWERYWGFRPTGQHRRP